MTCFWVDNEEHLFLMNDYITTHNTRNAVADACYLAFPVRYDQLNRKWVQEGHNEKVLYIMTEQSMDEIRKMILAYLTGINESRFKYYDFTAEEELIIQQALKVIEIYEDNLILIQIPDPNIELVKMVMREQVMLTGAEYVFYDYIFISPNLLKEFRGFALRNDELLLLFATALKDLAVELDVAVVTSTQVNAKADDNTNIRNEASLAGGRSTINKADYGCIFARPTPEELEILTNLGQIGIKEPNVVYDVFKVRDGAYTQVRIWSYMDLGVMRREDLFITDARLEPLKDFYTNTKYNIESWDEEQEKEIKNLLDELESGVI